MTEKQLGSLRIAIIGAGRIGSAFAFQLARTGGHEVTVVARPDSQRLRTLLRDQAVVDIRGQRADVTVRDSLDETAPYDVVIVTLLAHQVEPILPSLDRCAAKCIFFMFNTFDPSHLEKTIGPGRCAFGMPFIQSQFDLDGRLDVTIGAGGQKTLMSQNRWVDVFNAAGLPAAFEPDMKLWLRCHAPFCVAFESVSIAGMKRGRGASWSEARTLAAGVKASFGLIMALGDEVYPGSKRWLVRSPGAILAGLFWSLSRVRGFREVLATGEAECEALIKDMAGFALAADQSFDVSRILAMSPSRLAAQEAKRKRGSALHHPA